MMKKFSVKQTSTGKFTFSRNLEINEEVEIFVIDKDNKKNVLLTTTSNNEFEIELTDLDRRPFFLIISKESEYIIAERTLPIDGMNNFRDMGGFETYDGHTVKWGLLYRSDHIYNSTELGLEYLRKLNIHTIIDYRSHDEICKYPNKFINNHILTYELDPDAYTAELSAQFTSSKDNEDSNLVNKVIEQKEDGLLVDRYDIVMEQYRNFVHKGKSKKAFSQMLKLAANPSSSPLLQHCRGGKDRTGFGSMLLLGVLGVKKEQLIEDYMLTYTNRIERNNNKMKKYRKLTNDKDVLNYLYSLIETKPEFILASINDIEEHYNSIENYARIELGITDEEIKSLKSLYLE